MQNHTRHLLEELGVLLGCTDFRLDEQEKAVLSCDGLLVQLELVGKSSLRLSAWIGTLPSDDERLRIAGVLLAANHFFHMTEGATLAVDPRNDHIWLHQHVEFEGNSANQLLAALERFVETTATWFDRLNPVESPLSEKSGGIPMHEGSMPGSPPVFG